VKDALGVRDGSGDVRREIAQDGLITAYFVYPVGQPDDLVAFATGIEPIYFAHTFLYWTVVVVLFTAIGLAAPGGKSAAPHLKKAAAEMREASAKMKKAAPHLKSATADLPEAVAWRRDALAEIREAAGELPD